MANLLEQEPLPDWTQCALTFGNFRGEKDDRCFRRHPPRGGGARLLVFRVPGTLEVDHLPEGIGGPYVPIETHIDPDVTVSQMVQPHLAPPEGSRLLFDGVTLPCIVSTITVSADESDYITFPTVTYTPFGLPDQAITYYLEDGTFKAEAMWCAPTSLAYTADTTLIERVDFILVDN